MGSAHFFSTEIYALSRSTSSRCLYSSTPGGSVLKRIVQISSSVILVALALALLTMWSVARYYQRQFEIFSARAAALRVGQSKFADADELSRRYQSRALLSKWNCQGASCKLRIVLANSFVDGSSLGAPERRRRINSRALRWLGIRPAIVIADISVDNQVVQEVDVAATYQTSTGYWLWGGWEAVKQFRPAIKCDLLALQRHREYAVTSGHVEPALPTGPFVKAIFQPNIAQADRSRCQRIRFACMTSLDDCARNPKSGAGLFMPSIYEDIQADREVRSAIPEYWRLVDDCLYRR